MEANDEVFAIQRSRLTVERNSGLSVIGWIPTFSVRSAPI